MRIKLRGFEMAYDDTGGDRIPLLLIHGFPLDRTLWSAQIASLSNIARVIAPDLRGFGESGFPVSPATMDTYADDLCGLLDALGVKNAIAAGLSMGGYIAFAFYRRYAYRVRALILADTKATPDSPEGKQGRDANATLAREQGVAAVAEKMFPKMLAAKTVIENPMLADATRKMMSRQPVAGVVAALMAMRDRPDSTPTLAQISVPTLILVGDEDALIPPTESKKMHTAIRQSQLTLIPAAAHLANLDNPTAFEEATGAFIKTIG